MSTNNVDPMILKILSTIKNLMRNQMIVKIEDGGIGAYDYGSQRGRDSWPYVYAAQDTYKTNLEAKYDERLPKKLTVFVPYSLTIHGKTTEHELGVGIERMSSITNAKTGMVKTTWIWGE